MAEGDVWADLPPSTYQADGEAVLYIPWHEVGEDGALRVVPRVRPWQAGAKLDETGHDPDVFSLAAVFNSDVTEGDAAFTSQVMWPDTLEALVRQFKTGKTATLNLPWKRGLRVKPTTWRRMAVADNNRGGELLTATFKTDNEDALDREAFEQVSVKASVQRAAEEAAFAMEQEGMNVNLGQERLVLPDGGIGDPIGGIVGLAAALAGALNRPDELGQSIASAAQRLRRATQLLIGAYSTNEPGRDQMNGPDGASARAKLLDLLELAANAEAEALAGLPKTLTIIAERNTTIWDIATARQQRARELMRINGAIEDFNFIERGTAVLVFAE